MRIGWDGLEFGWRYLYWWNWLPKDQRYWGYEGFYYDGPHHSFGLWFTNVSWRL